MRGQALLASVMAVAVMATAQPAVAQGRSYHDEHVSRQEYCRQEQNNRTAAGALIGGLAGAVLGSQAAARGHRTDGSMLGGVLGAAAGAAIGRSSADCERRVQQGAHDPYYGQPYGGQYGGNDPYRNERPYEDDYGLEGGPYQPSDYRQSARRDGDCRWGEQIVRDPDGYEYRESVYMCRGRDGVWRPQA